MQTNKLNEALKLKEAKERLEKDKHTGEPMKLDDTQRVKVLSPSALVFKRFIRNRLAIVGSCILIFMFLFSFVGPLVYPYGQTQIFYKYDYITADYAGATERTVFTSYALNESAAQIPGSVVRKVDSYAESLNGGSAIIESNGEMYVLSAPRASVLTLAPAQVVAEVAEGGEQVATIGKKGLKLSDPSLDDGFSTAAQAAYDAKQTGFEYNGTAYTFEKIDKLTSAIKGSGSSVELKTDDLPDGFAEAMSAAIEAGENSFEVNGETFALTEKKCAVRSSGNVALVFSTLTFNAYTAGQEFSDAFKAEALLHTDGTEFEYHGSRYCVKEADGALLVFRGDEEVAMLSTFVVRDSKGNDSFDLNFKEAVQNAINEMSETGARKTVFTYSLPARVTETDEDGNEYTVYSTDEEGNQLYEETELTVTLKTGQYVITCKQLRHLIDLDSAPSGAHIFGTDSDGMDILARMMYGGRISLMVGFVVVILETVLGVILGGIAGYFGGWVDNLIMRLVDIFYCIPSMPILIIMGAFMDSMKVTPYMRLVYMMIILGVLGWAGTARLVRGQILSLREQEFMIATEATGLKVRRRIFRHLVPNVMPQLIVSATAGLGDVIITESTLSFLGLGVKHPLATWGTMINSVTSSNENMVRFTYIWLPVGLLICLTVIAFNFVGDGLRDAFDPKMKR